MGKIGMSGGGSSADLDVITAGAGDVLAGKVIVDQDGNPLTGTMPNRGAVSQSLAINGSYTIPKGYHNGSGKVSQSVPTQGAKTITPGANQQQVAAGRYLTGAITVPGFSMPAANLIKKGAKITIYGRTVTGTWEGYVASNKDIYNRGAWGSGYSLNQFVGKRDADYRDPEDAPVFSQETAAIVAVGQTKVSSGCFFINKEINLSPYNTLSIVFSFTGINNGGRIGINTSNNLSYIDMDNWTIKSKRVWNTDDNITGELTATVDVSSVNHNGYICFETTNGLTPTREMYIYRIYFT